MKFCYTFLRLHTFASPVIGDETVLSRGHINKHNTPSSAAWSVLTIWKRSWNNTRDGEQGAIPGHVEMVLLVEERSVSIDANDLWFQRDGAPPQCASIRLEWWRKKFACRLIARKVAFKRPSYSPDNNNPFDFFLWGYLKNRVYRNPVLETLDKLKHNNVREVRRIESAIIGQVTSSVEQRAREVIVARGAWIEHVCGITDF